MKLPRFGLAHRLAAGFIVLLAFTALTAAIGIIGMKLLHLQMDQIALMNNAKLASAHAMRESMGERIGETARAMLVDQDGERTQIIDRIKWLASQYDDARSGIVDLLAQPGTTQKEAQIMPKIQADADQALPLLDRVIQLASEGKAAEGAKILNAELAPLAKSWAVDIDELVSLEQNLNDAAMVAADSRYVRAKYLAIACAGISVVLGGLIAWALTRWITRQLGCEPQDAMQIANRIADGDLSRPVELRRGDATSLLAAMKRMSDSLSGIVTKVRESVDTVGTASSQIAAGNQDLSERTEQQASALEETAASMEELSSTVTQSAENSKQANQVANAARDAAVRGGEVVNRVVDTMQSIAGASQRMVEIINVIDGIAFQTNILALNAAVEAARAGEQGRGFAVVAGEVRSLAQRSTQAAREIKNMIDDSVQKANAGSHLVGSAGASMTDIVNQVKRVTELISEITNAALEQASGIAQVSEAVTQMDRTTQQNSALVEQSAAAATSLKDQARALAQAVGVFRLGTPAAAAN